MTPKNIDSHVLARYLSGDSTADERARVKQWINARHQNYRKFNEFRRIWNSSATYFEVECEQFDTEMEWERLNDQIAGSEISSESDEKNNISNQHIPHKNHTYFWIRVAAIFLICALIGFFAYENGISLKKTDQKPSLREITTAMGERVNLTLSDGTKVILNAGSKLKLPRVFDAHKREVFLEGEAYFHVAKNPARPFIIHSGKAKTRVLGTQFSVSAYPSDTEIRIAVKEGRVAFKANDEINGKQTILHNHEMAEYNLTSQNLSTKDITDMGLYLGWVDGYLKFRKAPMRQVAVELERRYGVAVSFKDEPIKKMLFTARLKSRSIKNVLNVISMSLKIKYQIKGDRVILMK